MSATSEHDEQQPPYYVFYYRIGNLKYKEFNSIWGLHKVRYASEDVVSSGQGEVRKAVVAPRMTTISSRSLQSRLSETLTNWNRLFRKCLSPSGNK